MAPKTQKSQTTPIIPATLDDLCKQFHCALDSDTWRYVNWNENETTRPSVWKARTYACNGTINIQQPGGHPDTCAKITLYCKQGYRVDTEGHSFDHLYKTILCIEDKQQDRSGPIADNRIAEYSTERYGQEHDSLQRHWEIARKRTVDLGTEQQRQRSDAAKAVIKALGYTEVITRFTK